MLISAASLIALSYGAWCVYRYMSKKAAKAVNDAFKDTDAIIDEKD